MSIKHAAGALIVLAIVGTNANAEAVARVPFPAGEVAMPVINPQSHISSPSRDDIEHAAPSDDGPLLENSWDFTRPESIPGFGALPPIHSHPVLPRFSTD